MLLLWNIQLPYLDIALYRTKHVDIALWRTKHRRIGENSVQEGHVLKATSKLRSRSEVGNEM